MHQILNLIFYLSTNNLDIIFFIYGLAFFVMGISILIVPKKESTFKLSGILWPLAWFGLIHGLNEWLDMWEMIKYKGDLINAVRLLFLITSFIFLFEFGRNLLRESLFKKPSKLGRKISASLFWWISPVIAILILSMTFFSYPNFWTSCAILARYSLGFPGALLAGFGFFSYYRGEESLKDLNVKKHFYLAGTSFIIYGILSGLVVPKGNFFPSNVINNDSFLLNIHIPVQFFRAVCAVIIALSVSCIIKIFNWEAGQKLKNALVTDELTGIFNRSGFMTLAEQQLKIANRANRRMLLMFADLDGMKWINDNLGHKEGDLALSDTAKILKNTFRESEIIGRIGGDEFAVLAVETDDTNTEILYQRLQKSIDEHNATANRRFTISMSIGMSSYNPLVPCSLEELLSRADNFMYENKKRKKNM